MIVNCYGKPYERLLERMNREEFVLTPILRDLYYHRTQNSVLCFGVMFENRDSFVISVSHDDMPQLSNVTVPDFDMKTKITEEDVKILRYINGQPINTLEEELVPYINDTHHRFGMMRDANRIVPITVWATVLEQYNNSLWDSILEYGDSILTDRYAYVRRLVKVLRRIEDSGIAINRELVPKFFDEKVLRSFKGNLTHTEYNPFTITGRPSNRFGGINYSALNKSDGSRSVFTTRYENGCLVQIDFEAYHLRLIADALDVDLPKRKSIHTELAKVYFGTEEITEEMYSASKTKTFEIMYGMSDETFNFELFEKIRTFRERYNKATHVTLPSSMTVEVEMPNASKLFNYYVQSLEVVKTLPKLEKVVNLLENTENHLVLYTYDSILLDMKDYNPTLIKQIVDMLEEDKKFPVRVYAGKTYDTIEEIK